MINGPMVHSINNSINSVLPSFENVQYPEVFNNLYNFVCKAKEITYNDAYFGCDLWSFVHGFGV